MSLSIYTFTNHGFLSNRLYVLGEPPNLPLADAIEEANIEDASIEIHQKGSLIGFIQWLFGKATYIQKDRIYVNNESVGRLFKRIEIKQTLPTAANINEFSIPLNKSHNERISRIKEQFVYIFEQNKNNNTHLKELLEKTINKCQVINLKGYDTPLKPDFMNEGDDAATHL